MRVEEAYYLYEDALNKLVPTLREQDVNKRLEQRREYVKNDIPLWWGFAEKLLAQNGTGYFVGNSITVADLAWYNGLKWHISGTLDGVPTNIIDGFPNLKKLHSLVDNHPKVRTWNAKAIRLHYFGFGFGGRGEHIRLALTLGNVPFEDIRLTFEEHAAKKAEWKFG